MKSSSSALCLIAGLLLASTQGSLAVRSEQPRPSIKKRYRVLQTSQNIYLPADHKKDTSKSKKETPSPTISAAPTTSIAPSAAPTLSTRPSSAPTRAPSSSPTTSSSPSSAPTPAPTSSPSATPTAAPTSAPSGTPSSTPSLSAAPTNNPFVTSTTTNSAGVKSFVSECTEEIPAGASTVSDQLLAWQYELVVEEGTAFATKIQELEEATHEHLAKLYLDCEYDSEFEVQRIQSEPFDTIFGNCESGVPNCVVVDAAVRMNVFYMSRRRRQLQTTSSEILPNEIATIVGQDLTEMYDSGLGVEGVVSTTFKGFTNGEDTTVNDSNNGDVGSRGVNNVQGTDEATSSSKTKIFSSTFAVAGAMIALIIVLVLAVRRRRDKPVDRSLVLDTDSEGSPGPPFDNSSPRVFVLSDADYEVRSTDLGAHEAMSTSGSTFHQPYFVSTNINEEELERSMEDLKPRRFYHNSRQYVADDTVDL